MVEKLFLEPTKVETSPIIFLYPSITELIPLFRDLASELLNLNALHTKNSRKKKAAEINP